MELVKGWKDDPETLPLLRNNLCSDAPGGVNLAALNIVKASISVRTPFYFASPDKSPAHYMDLFRRFYGPTMNAYDAAEKNGKTEELHTQLVGMAEAQNQNKNGGTNIPATFLRVTVSL